MNRWLIASWTQVFSLPTKVQDQVVEDEGGWGGPMEVEEKKMIFLAILLWLLLRQL